MDMICTKIWTEKGKWFLNCSQEPRFGTKAVTDQIEKTVSESGVTVIEGWTLLDWETENGCAQGGIVNKCTFINRQRETMQLEPHVFFLLKLTVIIWI